jgi:hypothetical protein
MALFSRKKMQLVSTIMAGVTVGIDANGQRRDKVRKNFRRG